MATRTALLNWNVINRDADFSKHIEAVSEPWVISWFTVTSSSVAEWEAFVKCERTNWDVIYALVYNTSAQSISWDWDVYIEVPQEIIDNWELWNEDWTEIAEIKVWTMPSKNAIKLATISSWVVTDARNIIKKSGELNTAITGLDTRLTDAEADIQVLQEAWAIDHLEYSAIVWELYQLTDNVIKQKTPTLTNSTSDCKVWDIDDNKQIHIQRIASGIESNKLKLKIKSVWSPTQNVIVEVRKWVQVTVTAGQEAYWYGNEVICSWSIAYWNITNTYAEIEVTMNWNFWGTRWELLDVVVYQANETINAANYYSLACDSKQISEWFWYVAVNGTTRVRNTIMPYCTSAWMEEFLLVKSKASDVETLQTAITDESSITTHTVTQKTLSKAWHLNVKFDNFQHTNTSMAVTYLRLYVDNVEVAEWMAWNSQSLGSRDYTTPNAYPAWSVVKVCIERDSGGGSSPNWKVTNLVLKRIWMTANYIEWEPKEVQPLWALWVANIYWMRSDWTYYWWIITWTSTEYTTGSISLWNAVWFIVMNYNWTVIKIPYYS